MNADQELTMKIAKWSQPDIGWSVSLLEDHKAIGYHRGGPKYLDDENYYVFEIDARDIEPLWQEHGQKVIEWKEKEFGHLLPCNGFRETWVRDSYRWLKSIATGTAHDKAVALGKWIDATGGWQ